MTKIRIIGLLSAVVVAMFGFSSVAFAQEAQPASALPALIEVGAAFEDLVDVSGLADSLNNNNLLNGILNGNEVGLPTG